ncbi:hypothetical protein [Mycoplasma sp. VS30B]
MLLAWSIYFDNSNNGIINNMKNDIFKKDLTIVRNYTIKKSVVLGIQKIAKETGLSESRVVTLILEDYLKNQGDM